MVIENDKFTNKKEMIEAVHAYAKDKNLNFDISDTGRIYKLSCKGRTEFHCDAHISITYKKREQTYTVRKIKLNHKCPADVQNNLSTSEYLRREIGDLKNLRIGEILSILVRRGIKVSYSCIYKALYEDEIKKISDENSTGKEIFTENDNSLNKSLDEVDDRINIKNYEQIENKENIDINILNNTGDKKQSIKKEPAKEKLKEGKLAKRMRNKNLVNIRKMNELALICKHWSKECKILNPEAEIEHTQTSVIVKFPWYTEIRPVVELKVGNRRENGFIAYAIIYDGLDNPLVYSFCVSESMEDSRKFVKSLEKFLIIIDYDRSLIELCESEGLDYFIKVRSICKHLFSLSGLKEVVENAWNCCNIDTTSELPLSVDKKRYKVRLSPRELFDIQNFSDIDLDFIYSSIYTLPMIDALNSLMKFISDDVAAKRPIDTGFGDNVMWRLNKNNKCRVEKGKVYENDVEFSVNLDKSTCTCGRFQELLIPCVHAIALIRSLNKKPEDYVSTLYSKETTSKMMNYIVPVVNEPVKLSVDRSLLKKGPGRPKTSLRLRMKSD
ncbi:hypothetical protein DMUE_1365 [Dictyocoela muelleri]|nr:hypothetical protein DMUE_1365 [Dictyocoela muelleri]